jgi:predicted lipid-binding transport protein (Tim44 family)
MSLDSLARRGRMVALASCALLLVPSFVMAKPSGGKSFGSRGAKTNQSAPPTNTAPTAAQPMQRTATPPGAAPATAAPTAASPATAARPAAPAAAAAAQAAKPSFARNMMMGIGAGLLGAGLFGLVSGSGLFGGLGGMASILGLLMQVALIGGLVWLAIRFFRRRQEPAMASAGAPMRAMNLNPAPQPMVREAMTQQNMVPQAMGAAAGAAGVAATAAGSDTVGLTGEDFGVFERLLSEVSTAFSQEDLAALQRYATPEMVGYFAEDLKENASKGLADRTSEIKLLQGDLAEAWVEGDVAYATVAMRFEAINVMADRKTGKVIEGNATIPQQSTELWTFACRRGGSWQVSAIQQPN